MQRPKGYSALRRGRFSAPGLLDFLTICVADRDRVLTCQDTGTNISREIERMSSGGIWQVHAFTLMPDHLHLVAELGELLSLSQAVARLKSKTKSALQTKNAKWQENYFDHRMAPNESLLPVLLYIYLNPYRKNLIMSSEKWPWFFCHPDDWLWFKDHLTDELPEPAWLL